MKEKTERRQGYENWEEEETGKEKQTSVNSPLKNPKIAFLQVEGYLGKG